MKNRYHPIRRLDATQYGHIDLVEDQLVGNKCVLKAVYKSAGEIRIHQWKMELRALTEIQSSHIPAVVDVIEDKDCYSLVESYIDGVPLDEWVAKHRFRKVRFRKRFFLELMQAVDDVHRTGFLYIDLKPANCLIMNQHLYLIDFNACMEIGGTSVILASRENYSKTMRSADQKGVELDIMGLLKMFRFLYPYHIHFFPRVQTCHHKRYQSNATMVHMDASGSKSVVISYSDQSVCLLLDTHFFRSLLSDGVIPQGSNSADLPGCLSILSNPLGSLPVPV